MTLNKHRRDFMKSAACAGSLVALSGCTSETKRGKSIGYADEFPKPLPKGLEYVLKVRDMVESLKEDYEKFDRAADICVEAIVSGKKVYYSVYGHNESQCILETKPGRPSFLIPFIGKEQIEEGDVLISQSTSQCVQAVEKGARVIGIIFAFTQTKFQGQGIVNPEYEGPYMEDICDVWFWHRTPFTVGIMDFDLMPWKSVPAHGAMDGIILGLILAKTIDKLLEKGVKVGTVEFNKADILEGGKYYRY